MGTEKNRIPNSIRECNRIQEISERVMGNHSKIRNEAIYRNTRYDYAERVHIDRGFLPEELIKGRLDILRKFNEAMIEWTYLVLHSTVNKIQEILKNDSLYFRCLEDVTSNPITELSDLDLERIQKSAELDKINKNIKEFIPLILPSGKIKL